MDMKEVLLMGMLEFTVVTYGKKRNRDGEKFLKFADGIDNGYRKNVF